MKKRVVCTLFAIASIGVPANAQKGFKYSAGAEVGYVIDHANNVLLSNAVLWGMGIGLSIQAEYFFSEKVSVDFLAGYISYRGKSLYNTYPQPAFKIVPIRVGGRYYIVKNLHIGTQFGIGYLGGGASKLGQEGTSFSYSPQVGYKFRVLKQKGIEITLKYDVYTYSDYQFASAGVRLAYVF